MREGSVSEHGAPRSQPPPYTVGSVNAGTRWRIITAVAGLTVVFDQLTKQLAIAELSDRSIEILPTLRLHLVYNSGFSFGTGAGFGPLVGAAVSILTIALAVQLMRETNRRRLLLFAAIFGGALGNLIDRLFRTDGWPLTGAVVDYIDVTWYAVFNLADSVLVVAVFLFIVTEFVIGRRESTAARAAQLLRQDQGQ